MVDTVQTYGTIDAAAMAGVTVRQLNHWAAEGYLRPERIVGPGRGSVQLRWDQRDIDAAARFGALSAALDGGSGLLWRFAEALTAPHDTDDAVGIILDEGRFTVSVEVRRQ